MSQNTCTVKKKEIVYLCVNWDPICEVMPTYQSETNYLLEKQAESKQILGSNLRFTF